MGTIHPHAEADAGIGGLEEVSLKRPRHFARQDDPDASRRRGRHGGGAAVWRLGFQMSCRVGYRPDNYCPCDALTRRRRRAASSTRVSFVKCQQSFTMPWTISRQALEPRR